MKQQYRVTVDVKVRVIVETSASSYEEAYENVLDDYNDSLIGDFVSDNWDAEAKDIDLVDTEIVED